MSNSRVAPSAIARGPRLAKKSTAQPLPDGYDPKFVEGEWYDWWCSSQFFTPSAEPHTALDRRFTICLPPPNVTGYLHIGHALTASVEDSLTRYHRMRGFQTLYLPGTDHAGIATQSVVENLLLRTTGESRHDLGREKFLDQVWTWKTEKGGQICQQLSRLGSSLDWTREFFTMDANLSTAVTEAFCRFYEQGKIKRDVRLVNWCGHLRTALSDLEVDHEEFEKRTLIDVVGHPGVKVEVGVICQFKYLVKPTITTTTSTSLTTTTPSDESEYLIVATTRLETMLGDVAVAVHPDDERYKHLIGRELVHPFIASRKVVVVGDADLVDPAFGTGCVKVTPAHDENDFKCGKKHNLPFINIFTDDGKINEVGAEGGFSGLHRFVARREVEAKLKDLGLWVGKKDHKLKIPFCSKSKDVIEPLIKPQWFLDLKEEAAKAVKAVRSGDLKILPDGPGVGVWYQYLENLRDWCVSRQLWWGHRIPAYKLVNGATATSGTAVAGSTEQWFIGRTIEEARESAAKLLNISDPSVIQLEQDTDVLDTWFSSGLLPMSGLGWPNTAHPDYKAFFPSQLLETGHDILFFWVARMVMMSIGLTDQLPFKTVYLHAMIRDAHGRKMSKSLGNVIDPIEVIEGVTLEEMVEKVKSGNLPEKEVSKAIKGIREDYPEGIPACGTDALRFGLLAYTVQISSINLDIKRIVGYRNFCNKIWNAVKFAGLSFEPGWEPKGLGVVLGSWLGQSQGSSGCQLRLEDRWILHRLSECARISNKAFAEYKLYEATTATFNFWLYELCDYYLELIKPRTRAGDAVAKEVLFVCLDWGLRLIHPLMPFLSEELWQRLPHPESAKANGDANFSICLAAYPQGPVAAWTDEGVEKEFELVKAVIGGFRSLTASLNIAPKERLAGWVRYLPPTSGTGSGVALKELDLVALLGKLGSCEVGKPENRKVATQVVNEYCTIYLDIENVDMSAEINKLKKEKVGTQKFLDGVLAKKAVAGYDEKVPEAVKAKNDELEAKYAGKIAEIDKALTALE